MDSKVGKGKDHIKKHFTFILKEILNIQIILEVVGWPGGKRTRPLPARREFALRTPKRPFHLFPSIFILISGKFVFKCFDHHIYTYIDFDVKPMLMLLGLT